MVIKQAEKQTLCTAAAELYCSNNLCPPIMLAFNYRLELKTILAISLLNQQFCKKCFTPINILKYLK